MKTRNPIKRVTRSIGKHGVRSTASMALRLLIYNLTHLVPNCRLKWAQTMSGGVVVCKIQGSLMKLDLGDIGISRELFLKGVHERHSSSQFREELRPGMVVLEIGANIGYYTLITLQQIGSRGSVVALEPSPTNLRSLLENLRLNKADDRVKVHPYAAGREPGVLPLYVMPWGNLCTFVRRDDSKFRPVSVIDVQVTTVDELLKKENRRVDYFRMDVEGYEGEVVEGMASTLTAADAPGGAFIEVHSEYLRQIGSSGRCFMARMYELGYEIKAARFQGCEEVSVFSNSEFNSHPLAEVMYWETFFVRRI